MTFYHLINQGALIGWIRSRDFLINITTRSHSWAIIACGRNKKLYFYGTQTHTDWLDLPYPTNNAYPLDIFVVNLRATLEIGAHSNRVEFHVNVPMCIRFVLRQPRGGKSCVVVPITLHTIHIGHASHHHDRCCVGSDRVSDSVAEKHISASSDSRVYQLCTTSQSPKLILRERRLRWMKLILQMKLIRLKTYWH